MPSIMQRIGIPNERHNDDIKYRKHLNNVDPSLSKYNKTFKGPSVEEIYNTYLQAGFDEFNSRQKRKDRRLDVKYHCATYLEYQNVLDLKARSSKNAIDRKGRPPAREIIWQFGNPSQGYGCKNQTQEKRDEVMEMLLECQQVAKLRYRQLAWGSAYFHADEVSSDAQGNDCGSFHLHTSFVPLCYKNKQGPPVQVAFERCLREMGFESFNVFKLDLDSIMEEVLKRHGLERTYMDNHEKHMPSKEFHRQQAEIRRTKELEKERLLSEQKIDKINLTIEETRADIESGMNEYIQKCASVVADSHNGVYDNALFYMMNCNDEQFYDLDEKGRTLKKELLKESVEDSEIQKSLDQVIKDIKSSSKSLSWQERNERWDEYNSVSKLFWELRKDYQDELKYEIDNAYQRRRDIMRSYYDAMYWLERSRGLLTTIIAAVVLVTSTVRKKRIEEKLEILRAERDVLIKNTADFARYSRKYREALKTGKIPFSYYMEVMTQIVSELDEEERQYRIQEKVPATRVAVENNCTVIDCIDLRSVGKTLDSCDMFRV